jgi:hypothetical protein
MPVDLTDEEVIARFMEPRPERHTSSRDSEGGWWRWVGIGEGSHWEVPVVGCFTLDRLRLVEERFTARQKLKYSRKLWGIIPLRQERGLAGAWIWLVWHASALQKKVALAAVLREEKADG